MIHIVLVAPEIPQNTGNIARTCAATGAKLHLVKPLGFLLADRYMKRAGLDYWAMADVAVHESLDEVMGMNPGAGVKFATVRALMGYADAVYGPDDMLVFGCESCGLPVELVSREFGRCVRIPMREGARSLNLSNSVAVILYEALRQQGFPGLAAAGRPSGTVGPALWQDYV